MSESLVVRGRVSLWRGVGVGFPGAALVTAAVVVCLLAVVAACRGPEVAYVVPASFGALTLALLPVGKWQWRQWERLTLSPHGIELTKRLSPVSLEWSDIASITARFPRPDRTWSSSLVLRTVDGTAHSLRVALYANGPAILTALKRWAPSAYALDATDERAVLNLRVTGRRVMWLEREQRATVEETVISYRAPSAHDIVPIDLFAGLRDRSFTIPLGLCLLLVSVGVASGLPLPFIDAPADDTAFRLWRGTSLVATIVGTLSTLTLLPTGAPVVHGTWRWRRFLGARVAQQRGLLTSLDGRRRYRQLERDMHDPFAGLHEHIEELDPGSGLTLRSHRHGALWVGERERLDSRRAWVARVTAPDGFEARCFEGKPWRRSKPLPTPAVLLLTDTEEGCFLTRFSADRRYAGDTLHETVAHAQWQATEEFGLESVEWTVLHGSHHDWSFWPAERSA